MKTINVGDICQVRKSKYLESGTFVKILMEVQDNIFLVGNELGNTIVVSDNLEKLEVVA